MHLVLAEKDILLQLLLPGLSAVGRHVGTCADKFLDPR